MDAQDSVSEPLRKLGPFVLQEQLGAGGMGAVWRAWDERLMRPVALKQILPDKASHPEIRARFQREAQAVARLNHPGIIQIYDILTISEGDWIVMELVEGRSLDQVLRQDRPELGRALAWASEIAAALAEAHAAGIVHRDLKAANVMITDRQRVKVLDFGLAREVVPGDDGVFVSEAGAVVGTYYAMSPEQATGRSVDHRSDLFSLGSLIYEMVTGVSPFRAASSTETLVRLCRDPPPPLAEHLPAAPPELSELLERLLEKDPDQRLDSAEDAAIVLSRLAGHREGDAELGSTLIPRTPSRPAAPTVIEGPASKGRARPAVKTLLMSDLVGSTRLMEKLGDVASAELFEQHERAARDLLERYSGQEIDKADGFLLLFDRPAEAVRFAGDYHRRLAQLGRRLGVEISARVGIHVGEVLLRENRPRDVARGAKPVEVEGLAKAMAARLMALAAGRQTLTSRGVFEMARRAADDSGQPCLRWVVHGSYRLAGMEDPVEVHEVGEDGVAPFHRPADAAKARHESEPRLLWQDTPHRHLGERRQLSVLCCDLVSTSAPRLAPGSSEPTAADPEILSEVLPGLLDAMTSILERYEGFLGDVFGHRLVAYFGYPVAHEDDAVRAVLAALELVEGSTPKLRGMALRVGIHTGSAVVAGGETRRDPLMLGSTFDRTAAVQALAGPGEVVVSAAARQLIREAFDLEPVTRAAEAWRVVAVHEPHSEAGSTIATLPMVSRERELELLLSRWQAAVEGRGQVVLIGGEAGIGKSRLVRAFRDRLPEASRRWWIAYGSPFLNSSPLAPVADLLRREVLRGRRGDEPEVELDRLIAFLDRHGLPGDEMSPILASFLELPQGPAVPESAPETRRAKTLEALTALLLEGAAQEARVLVIEDLHWMDPSTLELLGRVIEGAASSRLFVMATSRPEFVPPWERSVALTRIHLGQLTDRDSSALIDRVAAGRPLAPAIREQILAKTDGVPLFIEELTKTVLEADWGSSAFVIPATLRDSLAARLDRLGSARELAQVAATLGRSFSFELLAAISAEDEPTLRHELERLIDAELVYRKGYGSQTRYLFKHALIQDVAYASLLRKDRQALHRRIAEVLIERFPQVHERQPEIVAHHFTEAGDAARAASHWHAAGQQAMAGSAHREARRHFERALGLVESLPDRSEHAGAEVAILVSLGNCFLMDRDFGAPEIEQTWERAFALCEEVGDAQLLNVLLGFLTFYYVRGEFVKTQALVERILQVAEERGEPLLLAQSRYLSSLNHFFTGRPARALDDLARASSAATPEVGLAAIQAFALDVRVMILGFEALASWLRGSSDEALERSRRALELARETSHPFTLSTSYFLAAVLHLLRRQGAAAEEMAVALAELSRQHGFYQERDAEILTMCARLTASVEAGEAPGEELIERLTRSLRTHRESGSLVWSSLYSAHLVEARLARGQTGEAAELLGQAQRSAEERGEGFWQAELHRLAGAVEAARGDVGRALEAWQRALDVARQQSAESLERRARASLESLK